MVLDHERLYNELRTRMADKGTATVVRLQKSGGVVTRPNDFRFAERSRQIRKYFYGVTTSKLFTYGNLWKLCVCVAWERMDFMNQLSLCTSCYQPHRKGRPNCV